MSNHKPKPLILRIRRPEAYSLIRVPFHAAFCIMSSGFIKNHRKSPYVTLLDSCHFIRLISLGDPRIQCFPMSLQAGCKYHLEIIFILPILEPALTHLPCV